MRKIILSAFVVFICLGVFVTAQTLSNNNFGNYENNTYSIGLNCGENQTLFGCNCSERNVTMHWFITNYTEINKTYGRVLYKAYFQVGRCFGGQNKGSIVFDLRQNPHMFIGELEKKLLRTQYMLNISKDTGSNTFGTGRGRVS